MPSSVRATTLRFRRPCSLSASKVHQSAPKLTLALKAGEKPSADSMVPDGQSKWVNVEPVWMIPGSKKLSVQADVEKQNSSC